MDRRLLPLVVVVAGLWLAAAGAWAGIPPTPSTAACASAVERDTRAALQADPDLVAIRTPVECRGFSAAELASIVAGTTPVARPRPNEPDPTWTPAPSASARSQRATPPPRRPTAPASAGPDLVTTTPPTTPATSPTPSGPTGAPTSSSAPTPTAPTDPPVQAPEVPA